MRIAIIIAGLAALAYAAPYPQDNESPDDGFPDDESPDEDEGPEIISTLFPTPTLSIILTTSLNIPVTPIVPRPGMPTTSGKKSHWEPIPIFTKKCECNVATVRYPCWATDALQRCNYEEGFSYGCYMAAAGGCPTPTRACKNLFQPTPRPGPHPCELGQNPPLITSVPNITISIPVVPTLNVSLPAVPSVNVTLPVTILV